MQIQRVIFTGNVLEFELVHPLADYHYETGQRLSAIKAAELLTVFGYDTTGLQLTYKSSDTITETDDSITESYRYGIKHMPQSLVHYLATLPDATMLSVYGCIYHWQVPSLECEFTLTKEQFLAFLREQQTLGYCYINDVHGLGLTPGEADLFDPVIGIALPSGATIPTLQPQPHDPECNSKTVFYGLYLASPVEWIRAFHPIRTYQIVHILQFDDLLIYAHIQRITGTDFEAQRIADKDFTAYLNEDSIEITFHDGTIHRIGNEDTHLYEFHTCTKELSPAVDVTELTEAQVHELIHDERYMIRASDYKPIPDRITDVYNAIREDLFYSNKIRFSLGSLAYYIQEA